MSEYTRYRRTFDEIPATEGIVLVHASFIDDALCNNSVGVGQNAKEHLAVTQVSLSTLVLEIWRTRTISGPPLNP